MSKQKTKVQKKKKSAPKFSLKDERVPKVLGVICIFFALYLCVAFISYGFTWKADQDKVLEFSWSIIFQGDLIVENWLGRLGAFVSNLFMYWGFGIPSFLFVFLFGKFGFDLIQGKSKRGYISMVQYCLATMAFFSIVLAFIFRESQFTYGGIFGTSSTLWLSNFLGQIGLLLLLFFVVISLIIWYFNPSFQQLQLNTPTGNISFPTINFFKKTPKKKSTSRAKKSNESTEVDDKEYEALKPSFRDSAGVSVPKTDATRSSVQDADGSLEFEVPELISSKSKKAKTALSSKDAELEIEINEPHIPSSVSTEPKPVQGPDMNAEKKMIVEQENKIHSEPYDPTLDLAKYKSPTLELLKDYSDQKVEIDRAELEANKDQIIETLLNYKIEITKIRATIGPTVTLYEIVPAPGVKISKIRNLEDDIALSLAALGIRIIAPIPGKGTIGIEVPNKKKQIVSLRETLRSEKFTHAKMDLPIALGKTISNEVFVADLAKMPHLLIAGATGQGKSVGINTIIMSLLYKKHPSQVKLVLIDPKKVELFPYARLEKHFLSFLPNEDEPIVTDTSKVIYTLNSLCIEMDDRYNLLKSAHARNIKEYNQKFVERRLNPEKGHKFMPFIVLVIDEFADLMMTAGKEVELPISRLAQLARAVGIHLIIATQRPSVNIITGVIKANFPARLAFKVTSKIDSRTILDQGGADQLIGQGDMLLSVGGDAVRLQCAFVDTPEVEDVIAHIGEQQGYAYPFYLPEYVTDDDKAAGNSGLTMADLDPMFMDAGRLVVVNQSGSTSMLQRKLQLGYNRAGRIMDQLEATGVVGPARGSKPREVIIMSEMELDHIFENKL